MKIYQFKTENFRIVVDTEPEHCPDFSFDETEETREKVESGEWECFVSRASLYFNNMEIARDYLGQCIYENTKDFRDNVGMNSRGHGSYFSDMIRNIISEGRDYLKSLPKLKK